MRKYDEDEDRIIVPKFEEAAGFYTSPQRSHIMSRIKGKHSKPEMILRRALWARNIRFRRIRPTNYRSVDFLKFCG